MKRTQPAPGTEMTIPEAERYFLDKLEEEKESPRDALRQLAGFTGGQPSPFFFNEASSRMAGIARTPNKTLAQSSVHCGIELALAGSRPL